MTPTMEVTHKQAKTIKEYKVTKFGYDIVVPVGSTVSNNTACGNDDNYRFWQGWYNQVKEMTGFSNSLLAHDLTYYGLHIPAKYCGEWE